MELERVMLSSAPCSSSDLTFFSPSKNTKSGSSPISSVTVTTRLTRRAFPSQSRSCTTSSSPSARSSPVSNPPLKLSRKRKSLHPEVPSISASSSKLPLAVKRLRTDAPKEKVLRRNSSSSKNSSRASSHRLSSPEPIYRSERSRSISLLHSNDSVANFSSRRWVTDELGTPGENHLSSEAVVKQLMKSYKACELSYSHP
jgi:H3 lysine-79-specific histone-lysine N-methyltransferase